MREIEIKTKVANVDQLLSALKEKNIQLGSPLTQHDTVYLEPNTDIDNYVGHNSLRVRIENDTRVILTLKRTIAHLDKIEHEVLIDNPDEAHSMIKLLGYELYSDVAKTRRKVKYGDIELCLDEINDLGVFLEAEKLCEDDADGDAVRQELWDFVAAFGVTRDDEVTVGYDVLMRRHRDQTKQERGETITV